MARELKSAPPYCAACHQQMPERRYVDFEAAYDGPVIPGSPANISIDDLVICEGCLGAAFDILDPQGLRKHIAALTAENDQLKAEVRSKDVMVSRLERTVHELIEHPVRHRQGSGDFAGIDADTKKALDKRRKRRMEAKKHAKQQQREAK